MKTELTGYFTHGVIQQTKLFPQNIKVINSEEENCCDNLESWDLVYDKATEIHSIVIPKFKEGEHSYLHYFRGYFFQCSGSIDGMCDCGRNNQERMTILKRVFEKMRPHIVMKYATLTQEVKDLISSMIINEIIDCICSYSPEAGKLATDSLKNQDSKIFQAMLGIVADVLKRECVIYDVEKYTFGTYIDVLSQTQLQEIPILTNMLNIAQSYECNKFENITIHLNKETSTMIENIKQTKGMSQEVHKILYLLLYHNELYYDGKKQTYILTHKKYNKESFIPFMKSSTIKILCDNTSDNNYFVPRHLADVINSKAQPATELSFSFSEDYINGLLGEKDASLCHTLMLAYINTLTCILEYQHKIESKRKTPINMKIVNLV